MSIPRDWDAQLFANLRAGRIAQGGSTLTQQLAKNLFLTPERTIRRKVDELVLALWLELRLSKQDILELYLNRVYFGGGAYGIEAAAQRYFDKSARAMTLAEAAVVAGLLKAPSRYSPTSNPRLARARGHAVLAKMRDAGFITARDEQTARMTRLIFANSKINSRRNATDYAVDFALERLPPVLGTDHGEVIVETTLDRELQAEASRVVAAEVAAQGKTLAASQAALVILDTQGGIRAMVGGASYAKSQFNRAVKARRQPGSAFKPFVYLAALEKGYTPESVAYDLPFNLQGWQPKNDNGRFSGAVTLRDALTQSINTVAVRLMMDAGPDRVAALAARIGIESELRTDPSLALGTSEVSLLELTGAYGTFATGGIGVEPHVVRRIRSSRGRILYARAAPAADQRAAPMAIGQLNDMMQSVVSSGTGRRAAVEGHETAGKTGTSQDFRDAWFIGYTAQFVGGVWVGNDNGQPMRKVTGGNLPAQIWHKIMTRAHAGLAPRALPGSIVTPELLAQRQSGPQQGQAAELLPWQMPTKVPPRPAAKRPPAPRAMARPPAYPAERISDDFLSRVLAQSPATPSAPATAAVQVPAAEMPAAGDRKPALPGMMSLGAALR